MKSKVSVLAAVAFSLVLSGPALAQTSGSGGNDSGGSGSVGASDTGAITGSGNDQSGTAAGGASGNAGSDTMTPATGNAAAGTANMNFDTDGNGTISLDEFNTGIAGQDEAAQQQTLNGLSDDQIEQLRDECDAAGTSANAADGRNASCESITGFKRM